MSKADEIFIRNVREILNEGYSDQNLDVRPRWKDGTPAHNKKVWYRQPLRPERRVSDNHFEAHLFQDLHRRNALDLAEKIQ